MSSFTRHTRTRRLLVLTATTVVGFLFGGTSAALAGQSEVGSGPTAGSYHTSALPGGSYPKRSASHGGARVDERGTFQGYREDQGRGSRLQFLTEFREAGTDSDVRGAYNQSDWYVNGNRCYISSYDSPGVNCSSGWWYDAQEQTDRKKSNSYVAYDVWWYLDPTGSSGRASIKGCLDVAYQSDKCTSSILRGSSY